MSRSRIRAAEGGQLVQRSAEDLSSRCFLTAVPISEPQLSCPSVTVIVAVVVVAVGAYFFLPGSRSRGRLRIPRARTGWWCGGCGSFCAAFR